MRKKYSYIFIYLDKFYKYRVWGLLGHTANSDEINILAYNSETKKIFL